MHRKQSTKHAPFFARFHQTPQCPPSPHPLMHACTAWSIHHAVQCLVLIGVRFRPFVVSDLASGRGRGRGRPAVAIRLSVDLARRAGHLRRRRYKTSTSFWRASTSFWELRHHYDSSLWSIGGGLRDLIGGGVAGGGRDVVCCTANWTPFWRAFSSLASASAYCIFLFLLFWCFGSVPTFLDVSLADWCNFDGVVSKTGQNGAKGKNVPTPTASAPVSANATIATATATAADAAAAAPLAPGAGHPAGIGEQPGDISPASAPPQPDAPTSLMAAATAADAASPEADDGCIIG